jgi:hypothetical protein
VKRKGMLEIGADLYMDFIFELQSSADAMEDVE